VSIPAPASTTEAMDMVLTGLRHLAAADPTTLAAQAQADCLQAFEQAGAMATAARAWFLGAFTASQGYTEDADYSPTAWLIHRTKVTKSAARGQLGWARRAVAHPQVVLALAEGTALTESMARIICGWTDKLPAECQATADDILIAAARAGARKEDLAALAAEIYARSRPDTEDNPEPVFEDRQLRVETTFAGAGVITGDLTPECAAILTTVLESLSAPMGAEDTRTREQRYHDGLQEAMRRLCFCIMMDSWTTHRQTERKPSSEWACTASERDLRRGGVGADPARARHRPGDPARLERRGHLQG
jgi:hypothetical protein